MNSSIITHLLLLVSAVLSFVAAAPGENGKLKVISLKPDELLAEYRTGDEEGVAVISKTTDKKHHLSIKTIDGDVLISVKSGAGNSATLWNIVGYNILSQDNIRLSHVDEYLVPPEAAKSVEEQLESGHISKKLIHTLETGAIDEAKRSAFSNLFARPEMKGVMSMIEKLGVAGIKGHENQAAFNLYSIILNFAKLQDRLANALPLEPVKREPGLLRP